MLMQNMLLILCIIAVATYVVAWIEIPKSVSLLRVEIVATYVVAWIEIQFHYTSYPETFRRHLCSGVD